MQIPMLSRHCSSKYGNLFFKQFYVLCMVLTERCVKNWANAIFFDYEVLTGTLSPARSASPGVLLATLTSFIMISRRARRTVEGGRVS
jgi:hypothetical protein